MNWRHAFLRQARSDYAAMMRLSAPGLDYCHRTHYLQMASEKLAKAYLCPSGGMIPPPATHGALVRMLQILKSRHDLRRKLGFSDAGVFRKYINSLLELANKIEQLAPSSAGLHRPNPEYPWQDRTTGTVIAPADFAFTDFNSQKPAMLKFHRLIENLLNLPA